MPKSRAEKRADLKTLIEQYEGKDTIFREKSLILRVNLSEISETSDIVSVRAAYRITPGLLPISFGKKLPFNEGYEIGLGVAVSEMSIVPGRFCGYGWVLYLDSHLIEDITAIGETFTDDTEFVDRWQLLVHKLEEFERR